MEDHVFPSEAVASLMKQHLVESRMHADSQNTLTDEQFERNKKDQAEIAGTIAAPYFVMVDPETGKKISEFKLSGGFGSWPDKWVAWIEQTARKAGRKVTPKATD